MTARAWKTIFCQLFMTPISVMGAKLSFKLLLKYGKNLRLAPYKVGTQNEVGLQALSPRVEQQHPYSSLHPVHNKNLESEIVKLVCQTSLDLNSLNNF